MYDVIVIGAGPAGLSFSRGIAEEGFKVLVLEKDAALGEPRHDSGASFDELLTENDLPKHIIANRVNKVQLGTPSKTISKEVSKSGIILNRREFSRQMGRNAINAGVELQLMSRVTEPLLNNGLQGVVYKHRNQRKEVKGRLVVDASGMENGIISKKFGLVETTPGGVGLEKEFMFKHIDDTRLIHHGIGNFAPGGYSWIYPTSECSALVGNSVLYNPKEAETRFDYYVKNVFNKMVENPQEVEVHTFPCLTAKINGSCKDNFLLIGDVLGCVNPLWCEGLRFVTRQGKRDAGICANLLEKDMLREKDLRACWEDWVSQSKRWGFLWKLRGALGRGKVGGVRSDEEFNAILEIIDKMDENTVYKIFRSEIGAIDLIRYVPILTKILGSQTISNLFGKSL